MFNRANRHSRREGEGIAEIETQRLFAGFKEFWVLHGVPSIDAIVVDATLALQRQVLRAEIAAAQPARLGSLDFVHLEVQRTREPRDDVVLQLQEVGAILVETLRREMRAAFRVDELGVDAVGCTGPSSAYFTPRSLPIAFTSVNGCSPAPASRAASAREPPS